MEPLGGFTKRVWRQARKSVRCSLRGKLPPNESILQQVSAASRLEFLWISPSYTFLRPPTFWWTCHFGWWNMPQRSQPKTICKWRKLKRWGLRSFNARNFLLRCHKYSSLTNIILKIHILGSHCLTESVRFDSFCEGHSYPSAIWEARRGYGLGLQGHFSIPQSVHSRGSGKGLDFLLILNRSL